MQPTGEHPIHLLSGGQKEPQIPSEPGTSLADSRLLELRHRLLTLKQGVDDALMLLSVVESQAGDADDSDPLIVLGFSARVQNALIREGIATAGNLVERDGLDLLDIRNFGLMCLSEVNVKLDQRGRALKPAASPLPPLPTYREAR